MLVLPLLVLAAIPPKPVAAISAKQFLESLGVNVHMEYTDGGYANVGAVQRDLRYLGISFVRDAAPSPASWMPPGQGVAAIHSLSLAGIKFDIFVSGDMVLALHQIAELERFHRNTVSSIEGPNEINNWGVSYGGLSGDLAARKYQHDLYEAVRGDARLKSLPVYYFTGGALIDTKELAGLADFANTHPYPKNGDEPGDWIAGEFSHQFQNVVEFPKVMTETGYYTLPTSRNWGGVDGLTQAKAILTLYLDAARLGVSRTFVYQLLDAYPDAKANNPDKHFGFFDVNNTPKPSALAIHNLTSFLSDSKDSSGSLSFELSGLPATAHSLLLGKSNGSFVVAIWNEAKIWDAAKQQPVQSEPVEAELCLQSAIDISSFDPLNGTYAALGHNQNCAALKVPDHPIMIRLQIPAVH